MGRVDTEMHAMRLRVSGHFRKHALRARRTTPSRRVQMGASRGCEPTGQTPVATLIYELLDAHYDTAEMAAELPSDAVWEAHVDYLRALQREGRAVLARMPLDDL